LATMRECSSYMKKMLHFVDVGMGSKAIVTFFRCGNGGGVKKCMKVMHARTKEMQRDKHMNAYAHTNTHTHTHPHTHTHTHTHTHLLHERDYLAEVQRQLLFLHSRPCNVHHIHTHTHVHTYTNTHTHTHAQAHTHAHTHTHTLSCGSHARQTLEAAGRIWGDDLIGKNGCKVRDGVRYGRSRGGSQDASSTSGMNLRLQHFNRGLGL